MPRPKYRRARSLNNVNDAQSTSSSNYNWAEGEEIKDPQHRYRHRVQISPKGGRRRYGRAGSARSIFVPPSPRSGSENDDSSIEVPVDKEDERSTDSINFHSSMKENPRHLRSNDSRAASTSALNVSLKGYFEAAPSFSSSSGPMKGTRKKHKAGGGSGSMAPPSFGRKDSTSNNSISSVSLLDDSATPMADSLTSMNSSSSTIPPAPPQLLAPGNSELRWNACSSHHRRRELPPAFQGLTPPSRPRRSTNTSGDSMENLPLANDEEDDDETAEFAEDETATTESANNNTLVVDDRLPPAYQDAVRSEHKRKSEAAANQEQKLKVAEPAAESTVPQPENRQSDMRWDDQNACLSPKQAKQRFQHANENELPPAFKHIISPTTGKKRIVRTDSKSSENGSLPAPELDFADSGEMTRTKPAKKEMTEDDKDLPPAFKQIISPTTGKKRIVRTDSKSSENAAPPPPELADADSSDEESSTEDDTEPDTETATKEDEKNESPKRSWKVKRIISVDSYNKNEEGMNDKPKPRQVATMNRDQLPATDSENELDNPDNAVGQTEASDSPKARPLWKAKRIISVDSFNKKEEESNNSPKPQPVATIRRDQLPATDSEDELAGPENRVDQTETSDSPKSRPLWKAKRIISVDSFNKKEETNDSKPKPQQVATMRRDQLPATDSEDESISESESTGKRVDQAEASGSPKSRPLWKAKRIISVDSFNKKEEESDSSEDNTQQIAEVKSDQPTSTDQGEKTNDPENDVGQAEASDSPKSRPLWKTKRIISVDSFNKKQQQMENASADTSSDEAGAAESGKTEDDRQMSDSPTPRHRSWMTKRIVSVNSFNKQQERIEQEPAKDASSSVETGTAGENETDMSDIPTSMTRSWREKRVISVDSFNKQQQDEAHAVADNSSTVALNGEETKKPDSETSNTAGPKKRSWKVKRVISVDSFNKNHEGIEKPTAHINGEATSTEPETFDDHSESSDVGDSPLPFRQGALKKTTSVDSSRQRSEESLNSGQDTCETREEPKRESQSTYSEPHTQLQLPPGEETTESRKRSSRNKTRGKTKTKAVDNKKPPIEDTQFDEAPLLQEAGTSGNFFADDIEDESEGEEPAWGNSSAAAYDFSNVVFEPKEEEAPKSGSLFAYDFSNFEDEPKEEAPKSDNFFAADFANLGDEPTEGTPTPANFFVADFSNFSDEPEPSQYGRGNGEKTTTRASTAAFGQIWEKKQRKQDAMRAAKEDAMKAAKEAPPQTESETKPKRRGSTGALIDLFENHSNHSRSNHSRREEVEPAAETSSRRGRRTALAAKWSQELLPSIGKPSAPDATTTEAEATEPQNENTIESEFATRPRPKGIPRRRGSTGALARKWSQELLPSMANAKVTSKPEETKNSEELSQKDSMARKRELRLKARGFTGAVANESETSKYKPACRVSKSRAELEKRSAGRIRKQKIDEELNRLVKHAEDLELGEPIDTEVVNVVKRAAMKRTYTKMVYDVFKDQFIYFPTIAHTMMNYTVFEEAEKLYRGPSDLLPIHYVAALHSMAGYEVVKYWGDVDIANIEAMATDVEISDDQDHAANEHERPELKKQASGKEKKQKGKPQLKKVNSDPALKTSKKSKKGLSGSTHTVDSAPGVIKRKSSKKEKVKRREYPRSNSTGTLMETKLDANSPTFQRDKVVNLLPLKKWSKIESLDGETAEIRRTRSPDRTDSVDTKSRGRSKSASRTETAAAKKKAREKKRDTSIGALEEKKKKPKQRARSKSADPPEEERKKKPKQRARSRSAEPADTKPKKIASKGVASPKKVKTKKVVSKTRPTLAMSPKAKSKTRVGTSKSPKKDKAKAAPKQTVVPEDAELSASMRFLLGES